MYCYREPKGDRFEWHELLLHLSFFPTITSGPIIRAAAFKSIDGEQAGALAQIRTKQARQLIYPALAVGLIVLGIAKKWWLAGVLAEGWVSPVFENPAQFDGWGVLSAIYGYTFQLFFDFSGYSDLVIGLAMLLGFQLPKNFAAPLRATKHPRLLGQVAHQPVHLDSRLYLYSFGRQQKKASDALNSI